MLRLLLFLIILVFGLSTCSSLKKAMKGGELEATQSLTTVPIIKNKRLNFVEVQIKDETYLFFIDTGAPNIVSEELAAHLNLEPIKKLKTGDSQGNSQKTVYVRLPEMWVGDFRFTNTAAMIADLSGTPGIQCLGIDGIIGSNLMQKAIWQFDFINEKVHIARTKADLPHAINDLSGIPFTTNLFQTPKFEVDFGAVNKKGVKLDLGSANGIDANKKAFTRLKEEHPGLNYLTRLGSSSYGIFGSEKKLDSTYHSNEIPIAIAGETYGDQNIRFQNNKRTVKIGMKFWEHFLLTINWFENEFYLQQQKTLADTSYLSFGFSPLHQDSFLIINAMEVNGPAMEAGLQLGNQILELNEKNVKKVSVEQWCEWLNGSIVGFNTEALTIKVKDEEGRIKKVELQKRDLLSD